MCFSVVCVYEDLAGLVVRSRLAVLEFLNTCRREGIVVLKGQGKSEVSFLPF